MVMSMAGNTVDSSTTSQSLAVLWIVVRDWGLVSRTASMCVTECVSMGTVKQTV